MSFDIVDFHTHPFTDESNNISAHKAYCDMSAENTEKYFKGMGIGTVCGSVITLPTGKETPEENLGRIKKDNANVLKLKDLYGDFYVPGFHIHPDFVRESCEEIERMSKRGVKLIGELCPYLYGWERYDSKGFFEIMDTAEQYGMVVSIHSMSYDSQLEFVKQFQNLTIVGAHPGEYGDFMIQFDMLKASKNYYLDFSGFGIHRHGVIKCAVDNFGAERFLYGSDFPTCSAPTFLGGVLLDPLITDSQKELILGKNAKRILGII